MSGVTREKFEMIDNSFPYVLIGSTLGAIVSLTSVWIATVLTYAPVLMA